MRDLLLVFAGGAVGGSTRMVLAVLLPGASGPWPMTTFTVNVVGAALLGVLTGRLLSGAVSRDTQLLVGTGLLGSFTTYSTIAVESEALLRTQPADLAVGYLTASLAAGLAAAACGWWLGTRLTPTPSPGSEDPR